MCITLLVSSVVMLTVPVHIGRCILSLWVTDGPAHELYTAACGLYASWLAVRLAALAASWLPLGWAGVCARLRHWAAAAARALVALVVLVGVIPLCYGLLLEVVVIVPIRVPLNQTPVFFVFQVREGGRGPVSCERCNLTRALEGGGQILPSPPVFRE